MKNTSSKKVIVDRDETYKAYIREVERYNQLTEEQEKALVTIIENNEEEVSSLTRSEAIERLVNANLRLVATVANQFYDGSTELMDRIMAGNTGLIEAAHHFRSEFGVRFATYAYYWVRRAILREVKQTLIPVDDDGADTTNNIDIISLDAAINTDEEKLTIADTILPDDYLSQEHAMDLNNLLSLEQSAIHYALTPKEKFIIRHTYGIDCTPLSTERIATVLDTTPRRINQMRNLALNKLAESPFLSSFIDVA